MQAEEAFYASVEWTVSTASWLANGAVSIAVSVWDSTVGAAYNNWNKVYNDMQATGSGFWMSVYAATGTVVADAVGIVGLSNAYEGEDLYTGRQLSGAERVFEGVMGATQLITTACGGVGAIRSGIRSSGNCGTKLGKMFTNCCFTAETEVLLFKSPTVTVEGAIQSTTAEIHYFDENKWRQLPFVVTLGIGAAGGAVAVRNRKRKYSSDIEEYFSNFECEDESEHKSIYENTELLTGILQAQKRTESEMSKASEEYIIGQDTKLSSNDNQLDSHLTDITRTFTQVKEPWSRRFMRYAGILTVFACILTFMLLTRGNGLHAPSGDLQVQEASMNFSLPAKTQEPPKPEVYRKKISEIRIGEKSVGHNPQGIEASEADSEIFQKVKHNGYTLLYLKENQTLSVIELLRPENWLDAENIQIRRASDDKVLTEEELNILETAKAFEKDDEDYDLEVWIELPEMGVVGWATLVAIDGEVNIQDGPGNVVTGTFAHISDNVIDLQIEDQDKPIGCTANHLFWSVDRQDFIEAGQLLEGEQVQLYSGETKRVVQKLPRPGPQVVYNLEVYAEHVYHVTLDGVLVHNNCGPKTNQIHHFATNKHRLYTPIFEKIAKKYNLNLDGSWNKMLLPHQGRHVTSYHEFVLQNMKRASKEAGRSKKKFLTLYKQYIVDYVINNPNILYK